MRTARVLTNRSCNQNCEFCSERRALEDRDLVRRAAQAIDEAAAEEVVLSGGEPTMRRDLGALVARAKAGGARVVVETNAALGPEGLAGADEVRVHLPAWGAACDAITRDPGGFGRTMETVRALQESRESPRLVATAPVVAANAESLPLLPAQLVASGVAWAELRLGVPVRGPSGLLRVGRAAEVVAAVAHAARSVGLPVRLAPEASVPPCVFERPARVAHLYSLTRGGASRARWRQGPGCGGCAVADRCPGFPEGAEVRPRPLRSDTLRRRLSLIEGVDAQIARELTQRDVLRIDGEARASRIVRVHFPCNQRCDFCFVSTHLPPAPEDAVRREITEAARAKEIVVLSGGEPTLSPRLLEYVRLAKAEGAPHVDLQTNAVRLEEMAPALAEAGVDWVFVSLHAPDAATSDAITGAPGTHERTLAGIDAAVAAGMRVRLNFVFCERNRGRFPEHVDLVAARWPEATLVVSFVAPSTDVVPRTPELIPRYSAVREPLAEGLRRARAHGLEVTGFDSMCGLPLCLVPGDVRDFFDLAPAPEELAAGEMVRGEACASCSLRDRCFGLRRGYAEMYGTGELTPVFTAGPGGAGPPRSQPKADRPKGEG